MAILCICIGIYMHLGSMSIVLVVLMGIKTFHFVILETPKWYISIASWLKNSWNMIDHIAKWSLVCSMYHSLLIFFSYQPLKRLLILDRGSMTKSLFPYILGIVLFGKRKSKASSSSNIIFWGHPCENCFSILRCLFSMFIWDLVCPPLQW